MKVLIRSLIILALFNSDAFSQNIDHLIDREGLRSLGNDWDVLHHNETSDGGELMLQHEIWYMYFLHWRPLNEENRNITPIYVRHQLLNWWGPNMAYFTLKSSEGELSINGHKAYYVDGDYLGMVDTRFVIWNCEETNRQFIGDLNINRKLNTPRIIYDAQLLSLNTISCHGDSSFHGQKIFPKHYISEKGKLDFHTLDSWNTDEFESSSWYPGGISDSSGSIWTLPADSRKQIMLFWKDSKEKINKKTMEEFFMQIDEYSPVADDSLIYGDFEYSGVESDKEIFFTEGTFTLRTAKNGMQGKEYQEEFIFSSYLWQKNEKTYFLLASMINMKNVWNNQVNLKPDRNMFNKFLDNEVKNGIKVIDKDHFNRIIFKKH